jgi:DNA-binding MarR family transcriptional regulator
METTSQTNRSRLRQPAVLAWLRLARVFQKIDTRSERFFRSQGMNTAHFDVLAQIGAARGMTQQELADALLVTKGNISQLLGKLEQAGMITRQQTGRTNCLSLTAQGQVVFEQVVPQQEALIAELLTPLSDDEQRELLRLLRKLDHGIGT